MVKGPSEPAMQLWTSLLRAQRAALESVERSLKAAGLPPLSWYDVLLEVERSGDRGIRLIALEKALLLSQHGVSRLVKRMEEAGALERHAPADDRRGVLVKATASGRDLRQRMWPVYARAIEDAVGRHVSAEEAASTADILRALYRDRQSSG